MSNNLWVKGRPRVVDDEGKESALHPKQDLVPGIEIYGQNEIYELARDQNAVVRILNRFLPDQTYHDGSFASLHKRLKENAGNLQKGLDQKDELEGELAKLPKLTEQVQQFKELGIEEKLKQVPLLEKERRLLPRMEDELKRLNEAVSTLEQALPDVKYLSDSSLDGLPHAELLGKGRSVLEKLRTEFDGGIKQLREAMTRADSQLKATVSETQTALKAAEERLESEFTKLPDVADKRGAEIGRAYQMLLREIERIQPKTSGLNTAQKLVDGLQQERRNLLGELSDMRSQRTGELETAIKKLNRRLRGKLQLKLVPNGNREGLDKFIRELPGIGGKKAAWVIEADDLTVPALVDSIRKGVDSIKKTGWRITGGVADTLTKLSVAQLMDLESIDLDDQVDVQLNVSHEAESYRSLAQLSTGQQCTAILHLLLLDNQDPLILDQPEDNLDNAFIAERIVQELRDAKTVRQFLFATHNANIPVFGDAEWIGVFSATENHGGIPEEGQGSIDISTIRDQAAEILEGGKVAFDQRKEMYGF